MGVGKKSAEFERSFDLSTEKNLAYWATSTEGQEGYIDYQGRESWNSLQPAKLPPCRRQKTLQDLPDASHSSPSGNMEAWQDKRTIHNMNLRSVFSAEQQQILEQTKLDFSVVRTWVGNKRRKLASKAEQQNGVVAQGPPGHSLVGGGGALVSGVVLTPEMVASRNFQRSTPVTHLLPPASTSSTSPSPSSCSPHSGGGGHSSSGGLPPRPRPRCARRRSYPSRSTFAPTLCTDSPPLNKAVPLPRKPLHHSATSGPALYSQIRKPFSPGEPSGVPRSWARQYGPPPSQPWPYPSSQTHSQPQPAPAGMSAHAGPQPGVTDPGVRIQQVFTLAALSDGQRRPPSAGGGRSRPAKPAVSRRHRVLFHRHGDRGRRQRVRQGEELAKMGAQIQMCPGGGSSSSVGGAGETSGGGTGTGHGGPWRDSPAMGRNPTGANPPNSDHFGGKGYQTPPSSSHCPPRQSSYYSGVTPRGSFPHRMPFQGSGQTVPSHQQASGTLSAPWITSNSRKRTLQDRTQFSDRDLHTLKRYWDNGMTSLGSVCREKISAASTELSVDSEIVKTWIGNRRRKYRLMGIEIPPPKGGPAVFTNHSDTESPRCLTPDVDDVTTPEPGEDSERTDEVSICLSEDDGSDTYQREDSGDGDGETTNATLADNVKIEIIDDEEEEDGDVIGSDLENLQSLLEFKHEEVRYLESELENQKQKYTELQNFTRNLLNAVKNDDKEKQQELLASLPQEVEEDCEMSPEMGEELGVSAITIQSSSPGPEEMGDQEPL
ncbi:hypothetical protein SKAU_G00372820 [Synaphobranchus kaupii]|uniref:Homeobox domain-containing protein n=1 Tax=Synaphobranchus kaupii TaxID=118154 RepID=A0A9Q1EGE7_SYNKA|nr:hypothetical protein SKAU_G00372820 [Synaphobranchus kaupii]